MNRIAKLCLILLLPTIYFAQELSFSGYGATGFKMYNRNRLNDLNQETYYEGKLQADIKYNKHLKAQLDLRGNSTDNSVNFREFSLDIDYWEHLSVKIGNIKKPFGYEYLSNRDELISVDRSLNTNRISELGYGERAVSLMAYYKFDEDEMNFPYSYYISFFKDNSFRSGAVTRFAYHFDDDYSLAFNYMFQNQGGDEKINTNGFGIDFSVDKKRINGNIEVFYVQDPVEGIRRRLQNREEIVYAAGLKLMGGYKIDIDDSIFEDIEPLLVLGYFVPDFDNNGNHVIQAVLGANIYFDDDVRLRLNGDLRMTKNEFNDDYTTEESRAVFEVQVRF